MVLTTTTTRRYLITFFCLLQQFPTDSFLVGPTTPALSSRRQTLSTSSGGSFAKKRLTTLPILLASPEGSDDKDDAISSSVFASLTVPQLKELLRLRGLKVSGTKQQLIDRLENGASSSSDTKPSNGSSDENIVNYIPPNLRQSVIAKEQDATRGAAGDIHQGKHFRTVHLGPSSDDEQEEEEETPKRTSPEVWGSDCMVVEDYEGNSPILDSMIRSRVQFMGCDQEVLDAYVVASRPALKFYLEGGKKKKVDEETRLKEIQTRRDEEAKKKVRLDANEIADEGGDETGVYDDVLHRDLGDWGSQSVTAAQLSAQQVKGVILLSDVDGAFTDDIKSLADKVAFECQPAVVIVPDLFQGKPWREIPDKPGFNAEGQDFEEWKSQHPDERVNFDIRVVASALREVYAVNSVVLWGIAYGGGRALEVATESDPNDEPTEEVELRKPSPVEPEVTVAWYPTRYHFGELFGADKNATGTDGKAKQMTVVGIFAGNDVYPGASRQDAADLKASLAVDPRIRDFIVKVFPNRDHGFAHIGRSKPQTNSNVDRVKDKGFGGAGQIKFESNDAEMACIISSSFMEMYARVYLPTAVKPLSKDKSARKWNKKLDINDWRNNTRDIPKEHAEALEKYVLKPRGGIRIDPNDPADLKELGRLLRLMEPKDVKPELKIQPDDPIEVVLGKLKAGNEAFRLR